MSAVLFHLCFYLTGVVKSGLICEEREVELVWFWMQRLKYLDILVVFIDIGCARGVLVVGCGELIVARTQRKAVLTRKQDAFGLIPPESAHFI